MGRKLERLVGSIFKQKMRSNKINSKTLNPLINSVLPDIDLSKLTDVDNLLREMKPAIIVNAAAYTAVDKAEVEAEKSLVINGTAPGVLAEEAKKMGAAFVHYSTDYVFDGQKGLPYVEEDIPYPINMYGQSKLAGEMAIQQIGGNYLILRTSWVYGMRGNNFLITMLRLAEEREELRVVNDQFGAPTWSRTLAESTALILAKGRDKLSENSGIFHLAANGYTSWYEFARKIMMLSDKRTQVIGIPSAEYPTPAKRPAYSVLNNEKAYERFGIKMPDWETMLRLALG